jgi:hypothetical protein
MNRGIKQSAEWIAHRVQALRATWARKRQESDYDLSRLQQRLIRSSIADTHGCRLWTGSKFSNGYGCFKDRRGGHPKSVGAHRVAWEVWCGPIPSGLLVCHTCDVKACIKPDHLFLGTVSDNTRDAWRKGRADGSQLRSEEVRQRALATVRRMYRDGLLTTVHDSTGKLRGRKRVVP